MKKTKKIAVCAIFSALIVLLLLLASVFDMLDLTIVAIASILVTIIHIEIGPPYDYLIWVTGSALGLLLLPNKLPAFLYLLFGGIYPILKAYYERLTRVLSWVCKVLTFLAGFVLCLVIARYVLLLPADDYTFSYALIAVGTAAFVFYDIALSMLIRLYLLKLRHRFGLDRFFRT